MPADGQADVGGDAGAGGGAVAGAGAVAGGVELVVVQGGGGAPVPGGGAAAGAGGGGAFGPGALGSSFVPPRVVQVSDRVAQLRADGAGVAADEALGGVLAGAQGAGDAGRAVAHHVQGAQAQPGSAGVQARPRHDAPGHTLTAEGDVANDCCVGGHLSSSPRPGDRAGGCGGRSRECG